MSLSVDKLNVLFENNTVKTVVSLVLALYAGAAAPVLPNAVINFFDTVVGKLLFTFLIAFVASRDVQIAIMMAVAFVVTLSIANNRKIEEAFANHGEDEMFDNHAEEGEMFDNHSEEEQVETFENHGEENEMFDNHAEEGEMFDNHGEENEMFDNHAEEGEMFDNHSEETEESFKNPVPADNLNGNSNKLYAPFN